MQDRISIFNKLSFGNNFSLATRYIYEDRWGGQMNWTKADRGKDQIMVKVSIPQGLKYLGIILLTRISVYILVLMTIIKIQYTD